MNLRTKLGRSMLNHPMSTKFTTVTCTISFPPLFNLTKAIERSKKERYKEEFDQSPYAPRTPEIARERPPSRSTKRPNASGGLTAPAATIVTADEAAAIPITAEARLPPGASASAAAFAAPLGISILICRD